MGIYPFLPVDQSLWLSKTSHKGNQFVIQEMPKQPFDIAT